MNWFHSLIAKLLGKNLAYTPKEVIVDQMNEPRPLPMGRSEFEDWSNRIISGALVPCKEEDRQKLIESQKIALAGMIMHVSPTESHKPDAYFIHGLRKSAANDVAHAIGMEMQQARKARFEAEEAKKKEDESKIAS